MSDEKPFHLKGNFSPVSEEVTATDLEVIGALPPELCGLYARNSASATVGWARQAIASIDVVHSEGFPEAISIPIRVCTAGADALVSVEAQRLIAERAPKAKQVVVEGAKHELLMEIDDYRDRIFAAFGQIMRGMDVVKKIQMSPHEEQRLTPPVGIRSVRRLP